MGTCGRSGNEWKFDGNSWLVKHSHAADKQEGTGTKAECRCGGKAWWDWRTRTAQCSGRLSVGGDIVIDEQGPFGGMDNGDKGRGNAQELLCDIGLNKESQEI